MAGRVLNQECNAGGGDCGMQCNESERVRGLELGLVLSNISNLIGLITVTCCRVRL